MQLSPSSKLVRIAHFTGITIGMVAVVMVLGALLFSWGLQSSAAVGADKMTVLSVTHDANGTLQESSSQKVQFTATLDGKVYPVISESDTVLGALKDNGLVQTDYDQLVGAEADARPEAGMNVTVVRVTKKVVTETQTLWAQTKYVLDRNLMNGEYVTRTQGKNGSVVNTYEVVYEDGKVVSKTLLNTVRTEAVDQVIAYNEEQSFTNSRGQQVTYSSALNGIATAYLPSAQWGNHTYYGGIARPGVIAVDPKVIPLGTKVYVKSHSSVYGDYGFAVAWDIGSAIQGNKIDLYMESYDLSIQWGMRNVTIYILEDQSIDVFSLRQGNEVFIS